MLSIRNPEFAQALYANLKERENTPGNYTKINAKNILRDKDVYDGYVSVQKDFIGNRPMIPVYDQNKASIEHDPGTEFKAKEALEELKDQSHRSVLISK